MANDDKFLMILDKLTDISERSARMEVEQQYMRNDIEKVKDQDEVQNKLLAEHIANSHAAHQRLDVNQKMLETFESRIKSLEEPRTFLNLFKKYLLWLAAVGGAILAIIKWFPKD